jgi:lipid-A-disaccharide synthase-like uncharacterized protein
MSDWTVWVVIGFLGQALFTARFAVQWVVSERKRDSVVPPAFWWLSLAGGSVLLAYVVHRRDPVLIVGQVMGVFIYIRNLMLVAKGKRRAERRSRRAPAAATGTLASPHRVDRPERRSSTQKHAGQPEAKGLEERGI